MSEPSMIDLGGSMFAIGDRVAYPVRDEFGGDPRLATGVITELTRQPGPHRTTADYVRVRDEADDENSYTNLVRAGLPHE